MEYGIAQCCQIRGQGGGHEICAATAGVELDCLDAFRYLKGRHLPKLKERIASNRLDRQPSEHVGYYHIACRPADRRLQMAAVNPRSAVCYGVFPSEVPDGLGKDCICMAMQGHPRRDNRGEQHSAYTTLSVAPHGFTPQDA